MRTPIQRPFAGLLVMFSMGLGLFVAAFFSPQAPTGMMDEIGRIIALSASLVLLALLVIGYRVWSKMTPDQRRAMYTRTELERRREAKRRTPREGDVG